ncbi:hypothetical protein [Fervidobacterium thailandense]|uniref:Uncharacterized protein n=1 Tax=Fervidobacterium thailandense TaxID=1008305 RepID=A0A1E3G0J0_9BACT|nr:hypothetical protein [Fervidobacterium thailandense]ODN29786.1 hypothetical protein A4H02_08765 [Fervidobacterium thailandense]
MAKRLQILFFLIVPLFVFSLSTNSSVRFTLTLDFQNEEPTQSFQTEFNLNANALGKGFDLSFGLSGSSLSTARVNFKFNDLGLQLYKNQTFGSSADPVVLYNIKDGQDGVSVRFGSADFVAFNTLDLMYIQYGYPFGVVILGKRGDKFDTAVSFGGKFGDISLTSEVVWQDFVSFKVDNTVFLFSVAEKSSNWGVRYLITPSKELKLSYSPQSLGNNNILSLWYKFDAFGAKFNTYLNTKFDFDGIVSGLMRNSEIGADFSLGELFVYAKKTGLDDITGVMPTDWGKFSLGFSYGFSMFEGKGKIGYSFGKPAHNTVSTLGEVFYGEYGRSFGNIHLFAKYQKIIGYYEEPETFFLEAKITGLGNAEVKFWLGNGDFYNNNTFKPIVGAQFSMWW